MIEGVDVSNNNGTINWPEVAAAGKSFAIIKCSEGVHFSDPLFSQNWEGAKAAGLIVGAYAFCRPDLNSPEAEAAYFVSLLPDLQPGDLAALDVETLGSPNLAEWVLACAQAVEKALGFPPLIYSFAAFITEHLELTALNRYPLWLADWAPSIPTGIGPWAEIALWQYSGTGSCPGVTGQVDLNRISRDVAGLKALGKPAPKPTTIHAHVAIPGVLKAGPSHASAPIPDPAKPSEPYELPVGTALTLQAGTGKDPTTGEMWEAVQVTKPAAHGWFLKGSIQVDVSA